MPSLINEEDILHNHLTTLINSQKCIEMEKIIPDEYKSSEIVCWLIYAIESQRADTMKEVINLYEEVLHKERLESMQREQVSMQREQVQIAKESLTQQQNQQQLLQQQITIAEDQERYARRIANSAKYGNIVNTLNTVRHWNDKKK